MTPLRHLPSRENLQLLEEQRRCRYCSKPNAILLRVLPTRRAWKPEWQGLNQLVGLFAELSNSCNVDTKSRDFSERLKHIVTARRHHALGMRLPSLKQSFPQTSHPGRLSSGSQKLKRSCSFG